MKVVHITASHRGGAGTAALRLHNALRIHGVSSAYVSKTLTINFEGAEIQDSFFKYKKMSFKKRVFRKIQRLFIPSGLDVFQREVRSTKNTEKYEVVTNPWSQFSLEEHPLIVEATIINLHWIGGVLDMKTFFEKVKKPVVWTLHDMNPFLGIFHYETDQLNNLELKSIDARVKEIKKKAIHNIQKGAIVSPSQWLLNKAVNSSVFAHFEMHECIPNSVDLTIFKPRKHVDIGLNLSTSDNVLLFTAGSVDIKRKGFDVLLKAIEMVTIPLVVLVLGDGSISFENEQIIIHRLGFVEDQEKIATYYASSDALVLPSKEDNLPNTMLEALATGTPVISFCVGGMIEHLENNNIGMLINTIDAKGLAVGIEAFFKNKNLSKEDLIRDYAEMHFSPSTQAKRYTEVYDRLVATSS